MASLGEATIKLNIEPSDELKAFIRAEVRKALQDITRQMRMAAPAVSCPPRVPVQDLPAWARHEETGGTSH